MFDNPLRSYCDKIGNVPEEIGVQGMLRVGVAEDGSSLAAAEPETT